VLHDQEKSAVFFTDVVEGAYVLVVQAGNGTGLSLKSFPSFGIIRKVRGKNFDGDDAVETGVFGLVHLTHTAGANEREDLVGAQARTGF
jgi:hypothetical protein